MTLNDLLIDKRIVQRNIEQGKLDSTEYQKLLEALPDLADKVWRRPEGAAAAPSPSAVKRLVAAPAAIPPARTLDHALSPGVAASAADDDLDDEDEDDEDIDDLDEGEDGDDGDEDGDDEDGDDDEEGEAVEAEPVSSTP